MWSPDFQNRLRDWSDLRRRCHHLDLESALLEINQWWSQTPWRPYYLHWDDHESWPDPWSLLADNVFCDVARALGMLYTIALLERSDITDLELAQCSTGNLVLVNKGKYILNWNTVQVLNISSNIPTITRTLDRDKLSSLIG